MSSLSLRPRGLSTAACACRQSAAAPRWIARSERLRFAARPKGCPNSGESTPSSRTVCRRLSAASSVSASPSWTPITRPDICRVPGCAGVTPRPTRRRARTTRRPRQDAPLDDRLNQEPWRPRCARVARRVAWTSSAMRPRPPHLPPNSRGGESVHGLAHVAPMA